MTLSSYMHTQKHTEETKRRISKVKKLQHVIPKTAFKKGVTPWNKGKKYPQVSERNRTMNKLRIGDKHWNWKGGISKIEKSIRCMPEYVLWRAQVFTRDSHKCKLCDCTGYLNAHHIKPFIRIVKENLVTTLEEARKCFELWDVNNGITVCRDCHSKIDKHFYNRVTK